MCVYIYIFKYNTLRWLNFEICESEPYIKMLHIKDTIKL